MKNTIRIKGLRQRWLINSLGPIVLVALLGAVVYSVAIANYYYTGMRSDMVSRARAETDAFNTYAMNTYNEFYQQAYRSTESFEDREQMELQFLNSSGRILVSSFGVTAGLSPGTSDITAALADGRIEPYFGEDPATGQAILAVSAPLEFNGRVVGVMRYVTSLDRVNRTILLNVLVAVLVVPVLEELMQAVALPLPLGLAIPGLALGSMLVIQLLKAIRTGLGKKQ